MVEIEPGDRYDERFEQLEQLGRGKFGVVYKVTEKSAPGGTRVAKVIKCLKEESRLKVREEITIMSSLRHPKLLQLFAAFERKRDLVMVMEYISGGELFELVAADEFSLTEWDGILFMRQICEGVAYMHKNGIVHLDLKPENILCIAQKSHQIKLIDFGFAKRLDPKEPCSVLFGTPEFVAPEVVNYDPISFATDMWSVGVICYVLLSGFSPFLGDTDAETFVSISRANIDFDEEEFESVSQEAKEFILNLLVKDQSKRPSAEKCLDTGWLNKAEETLSKVVLPTDKLKTFLSRRKWQKTGNAIRAIGRMANHCRINSSGSPSPAGSENQESSGTTNDADIPCSVSSLCIDNEEKNHDDTSNTPELKETNEKKTSDKSL